MNLKKQRWMYPWELKRHYKIIRLWTCTWITQHTPTWSPEFRQDIEWVWLPRWDPENNDAVCWKGDLTVNISALGWSWCFVKQGMKTHYYHVAVSTNPFLKVKHTLIKWPHYSYIYVQYLVTHIIHLQFQINNKTNVFHSVTLASSIFHLINLLNDIKLFN